MQYNLFSVDNGTRNSLNSLYKSNSSFLLNFYSFSLSFALCCSINEMTIIFNNFLDQVHVFPDHIVLPPCATQDGLVRVQSLENIHMRGLYILPQITLAIKK